MIRALMLFTSLSVAAFAMPQATPEAISQPEAVPQSAGTQTTLPEPPADWRIWPRVNGAWSFDSRKAELTDGIGRAVITIRCDRQDDAVYLTRHLVIGDGNALTLMTSFNEWTIAGTREGHDDDADIRIRLPKDDRLLDQIVYSRGYFGVRTPANQAVRIPAAPEIARIVEQCRA
ncbi:MAG: hypothetical protein AAFX04_02590 [Pseudomonadota bacterium]